MARYELKYFDRRAGHGLVEVGDPPPVKATDHAGALKEAKEHAEARTEGDLAVLYEDGEQIGTYP